MSIVTKTGDHGETGLANGQRILKSELRVHAMGEVDELNAHVGCLLSGLPNSSPWHDCLEFIQHYLFNIGAELALPDSQSLVDLSSVQALEQELTILEDSLPPLHAFILPGGTQQAALAHVCRTVCRRAERALVAVHREEVLNSALLMFINRLSDYFFVLARALNQASGQPDIVWQRR